MNELLQKLLNAIKATGLGAAGCDCKDCIAISDAFAALSVAVLGQERRLTNAIWALLETGSEYRLEDYYDKYGERLSNKEPEPDE